MTIEFTSPELTELTPKITVFGVGGAGGNAVNNMVKAELKGVDFVCANTDAQALSHSLAQQKIQLGAELTQGLGAGARPEVGKAAAEETSKIIIEHLDGCHMAFITAGMGGGTGTGAAPTIAKIAREKGILTVGVVTKPFQFEGGRRMKLAEEGILELSKHVDTLIIIPNQNLFRIANERTTFADAFAMADEVLHSGVRGVTDLMMLPGLVNLDFADVRTVMSEMGKAMMGTGEAEGDNRALEAAEAAISNPLLDEVSMKGAQGVLINITGGMDLTLFEVDEAANRIRSEVDSEANILVGSSLDPNLDGKMRVSVVATGMENGIIKIEELSEKKYSILSSGVSETNVRELINEELDVENDIEADEFIEESENDSIDMQSVDHSEVDLTKISDASFIMPEAIMPEEAADFDMVDEEHSDPYAEAALENIEPQNKPKIKLGLFQRLRGAKKEEVIQIEPALKQGDMLKEPKDVMKFEVDENILEEKLTSKQEPNVSKDRLVRNEEADDHLEIPAFLRRQAN
ncbi:MAG: cell division protein FtsZ [Emcibacteraceae bacterium]|nr:cell division protein FtsZ [Emcibacteraceae bacterium]